MAVHEEILALARSRPADALKRIGEILDLGEIVGINLVRIFQAGGLASRLVGDLDRSNRFLRQALDLAVELDDETGIVQANITRAGNSLLAGSPEKAIERLHSLGTPNDPELAARLSLQLGTIYARTARFEEAVGHFTRALEAADQAGDQRLMAATTKNRGMLRTYSGQYREATHDFETARSIFADLGLDIEVAYCDHNLGLIADYSGDLRKALHLFASAEGQIATLAGSQWEVQASRCDALLHAGLAAEAAELASEIAEEMQQADHELDRSEALITWAKAEMLRGDLATAHDVATKAIESCTEQGRSDWLAQARIVQNQARSRMGETVDIRGLEALATSLDAEHHSLASLEADLAVVEEVTRTDAGDALDRLSNMRTRLRLAPVSIRLAAASFSARARMAIGDLRGADAAARAAFRLLYEYQSALGSGDLRVAVRTHARDAGAAGLSVALRGHNPRRVFEWLERDKWATLYGISPPSQYDWEIRTALAKYRALGDYLADVGGNPNMLRQCLQAERDLRDVTRARGGSGNAIRPLRAREVIARAAGITVLAVGEHEGRLLGIKLRAGRATQHDLGSALQARRHVRQIRSVLLRQMGGAISTPPEDVLEELSDQLLSPLGRLDQQVLVLPPPFLFGAPWRALPGLREHRIALSPSATLWHRRKDSEARSGLLLVAGPDLREGETEIQMLTASSPGSTVLQDSSATIDNVVAALGQHGVAHIAAHGKNRTDNPMFSSLAMSDGPLSVYDVGRIDDPPHLVVLSACHVGLAADKPGRELLGLVGGLLRAGTRTVVASTLPLPDTAATVEFMAAFHSSVAAGTPATGALLAADQALGSPAERLLYRSAISLFGGD